MRGRHARLRRKSATASLSAVHKKHSNPKFMEVARLPPRPGWGRTDAARDDGDGTRTRGLGLDEARGFRRGSSRGGVDRVGHGDGRCARDEGRVAGVRVKTDGENWVFALGRRDGTHAAAGAGDARRRRRFSPAGPPAVPARSLFNTHA